MLVLNLPAEEAFDEENQQFIAGSAFELHLEHSLLSLSKWESKFEKPFLGKEIRTPEETLWYIEAMILDPVYPANFWNRLNQGHMDQINAYIESKHSATTFGELPEPRGSRGRPETITSELIYYWMVAFNIPFETEKWHLNRLFSLIRICNMKNSKPKKMSKGDIARRNRELNAQRRAQLGTTG